MLTKDLLRYQTYKDTVSPSFVNPDDPELLGAAQQLLDIFESSVGNNTREELLESSKEVIDSSSNEAIIMRGLEKLLLDRTEFETTSNPELLELRKTVFLKTSELLSRQTYASLQEYQKQLEAELQLSSETLGQQLYSDLPPYQQIIHFKPFSPVNLLHRYNCAQVQGLLLRCNRLDLKVSEGQPGLLRQLCKYLRFHQLLAQITLDEDKLYHFQIDGPLSLFYQTQKYGLNLANFFPAILHQPTWQLSAQIQLTKQKLFCLELNQACQIRSHYQQFLAYIPEEIELFQQTFQQKSQSWHIEPATHFIPLEGELYCFPDYTLKHVSGREMSMELFHTWHASHLIVRLQQLERCSEPPLLIGITRNLLKDSLVAQSVENSAYFSQFGFTFREMPTADKVLPLLESLTEATLFPAASH